MVSFIYSRFIMNGKARKIQQQKKPLPSDINNTMGGL